MAVVPQISLAFGRPDHSQPTLWCRQNPRRTRRSQRGDAATGRPRAVLELPHCRMGLGGRNHRSKRSGPYSQCSGTRGREPTTTCSINVAGDRPSKKPYTALQSRRRVTGRDPFPCVPCHTTGASNAPQLKRVLGQRAGEIQRITPAANAVTGLGECDTLSMSSACFQVGSGRHSRTCRAARFQEADLEMQHGAFA